MFSAELFKTLLLKLNQPSSLAVAMSLGIHIILGVSVQSSSLFSKAQDSQNPNTVEVIDLNELETLNLPQLSAPPPPNTPLPNIDDLFPTTDLNPQTSSPTPDLQKSQSPLTYPITALPPLPRIRTPDLSRNRQQDSIERIRREQALERQRIIDELKRRQRQRTPRVSPKDPTDLLPGSEEKKTPPPPQPAPETLTDGQIDQLVARKSQKKKTEDNQVSEPAAPPPTQEEIEQMREEKIAALAETLQEEGQKLRQDGTSPDDNQDNLVSLGWLTEKRQEYASQYKEFVEAQTLPPLTGQYPQAACFKQLEGTAVYGVLINPEGEILETKLIRSSGYPILNEQGEAEIQGYQDFEQPEADKLQPYWITVEYTYDPEICPSITREQ